MVAVRPVSFGGPRSPVVLGFSNPMENNGGQVVLLSEKIPDSRRLLGKISGSCSVGLGVERS
jgi:hypothetical protein